MVSAGPYTNLHLAEENLEISGTGFFYGPDVLLATKQATNRKVTSIHIQHQYQMKLYKMKHDGELKMRDWKLRNWKMGHQTAILENMKMDWLWRADQA